MSSTDVAGLVAQLARRFQPQAGRDQKVRVLAVLQPLRAVGGQIGAGLEVGAVLVDPGAQPAPSGGSVPRG